MDSRLLTRSHEFAGAIGRLKALRVKVEQVFAPAGVIAAKYQQEHIKGDRFWRVRQVHDFDLNRRVVNKALPAGTA